MEYLSIKDIKPKHEGSKRMFKNPILHHLSRSHISIPIAMLALFAIGFMYWGTRTTDLNAGSLAGLFFAGLFIFTLFEYLMHRYLYHMVPRSKIKGWIQYNIHGVHHEYPKDKTRLAMPPVMIIIGSFLFLEIFRLIMGPLAFGFTPGFLMGYASYLCVHYIVHAFQPPNNGFKILWINHSIHHYKDPDVAFGVSSPFWDYIFGTIPKKKNRRK